VGVESFLWLDIELQDKFHVPEVISEASLDSLAGIGEIRGLAGVGSPVTLAEILMSLEVFNQPPHVCSLVNKSVDTKWKSRKLIHSLFTSRDPSSWADGAVPYGNQAHPGLSGDVAKRQVEKARAGRAV
jgi:hypothetical protein